MKTTEFRGDKALDALVDIIDPAATIISDSEIEKAYQSDRKLEVVKLAIKKYKREVTTILAILDGEDPETYKPGIFTVPKKLLEILNDPELSELFTSQGTVTSSGSVMESTEVKDI